MFAFFKNLWWLVNNTLPTTPITGAENGIMVDENGTKALLGGKLTRNTTIDNNGYELNIDITKPVTEVTNGGTIHLSNTVGRSYLFKRQSLLILPEAAKKGFEVDIITAHDVTGIAIQVDYGSTKTIIYNGKEVNKISDLNIGTYIKIRNV